MKATELSEGNQVAPPVGAWIETLTRPGNSLDSEVAPPVGAWIETCILKCLTYNGRVAPPVGAWIETPGLTIKPTDIGVAPPVGAWIETTSDAAHDRAEESRPPWARGLKHTYHFVPVSRLVSRAPRGRVD